MCDRSPLFLSDAKSIINDLLKRTLELFDLSLHLAVYDRLNQYLSKREQNRDYPLFSLHKPCKLNDNIISDLNKYLDRLSTSCRLIKSHLRSLHAIRLTSSNDYIVIDDEISDLVKLFQSKLVKLLYPFQSSDHLTHSRYYSQRQIHNSSNFIFHPEISNDKNNSQTTISSDNIFISFEKISRLYQFLLEQLYGVHIVRDSDILQPIVIHIIRLLLSITNKLKENLPSIKINSNHFTIQQNEEICQAKPSTKTKYHIIDNLPEHDN